MNWNQFFPSFFPLNTVSTRDDKQVDFLDIGCGYGGLLGIISLYIYMYIYIYIYITGMNIY